MNRENNKRIDEILQSLNGIQRAEAPLFLYSKIKNRMQPPQQLITQNLAWRVVVALLIMAVLNLLTLQQPDTGTTPAVNGAELVASEYSISLPQTY